MGFLIDLPASTLLRSHGKRTEVVRNGQVVETAHAFGIPVEAELGRAAGHDQTWISKRLSGKVPMTVEDLLDGTRVTDFRGRTVHVVGAIDGVPVTATTPARIGAVS